MARQPVVPAFLGFKKQAGEFRAMDELKPEMFYPPEELPPAYAEKIAAAVIQVLGKPRPPGVPP